MKSILLILLLAGSITGFSQKYNLTQHLKSNNITIVNRDVSTYETGGIELSAREGDGLAILKELEFDNGTIKLEIKGENSPGRSFVGLAFNIENDSTYEAVYFRPFNFVAKKQERRSHLAQYIYHPTYTWRKLRKERTGEFEGEMIAPTDPDDWFAVEIKITDNQVVALVEGESAPVLEIDRLNQAKSQKIGLWVGFGSSGRFKNLQIIK